MCFGTATLQPGLSAGSESSGICAASGRTAAVLARAHMIPIRPRLRQRRRTQGDIYVNGGRPAYGR
jgi:hypothetical protein